MLPKPAVCHSSPILTNLPFHDSSNYFNHKSWFTILGTSWKGRFVKIGDEWHTAAPNEDFGSPNQHFRICFRSTFQRFVAQIRYSHPWKVLRKCTLKCWLGRPKSSLPRFGRAKSATFCSPQCDCDVYVPMRLLFPILRFPSLLPFQTLERTPA